jgi:uncharacterized protein (UPF0335 family)
MSEGNVAADQLRLLIERIERLEEEKKGINDDIKDVYLEAKANGYDAKIMRQIVRLRKMQPHDRQEMQAVLETYLAALGMDEGGGRSQPRLFDDHDGRPDPTTPAPAPSADESELFMTALNLVVDNQKSSTSWLQRQMRIGYNSAARLIEQLEARGVVGPPNHIGAREVLIPPKGEAHPALAKLHALCAENGTSISMSIDGGPMIPLVTAPGADAAATP